MMIACLIIVQAHRPKLVEMKWKEKKKFPLEEIRESSLTSHFDV